MTREEIDAIVYRQRQLGDDTTYAIVNAALAEQQHLHKLDAVAFDRVNESLKAELATLRAAATLALEALRKMQNRWKVDLPMYWTDDHEQLLTALQSAL